MRVPVENSLYTEEELLKMSKKRAVDGLSEKVQRFCEFYVEGHNRKMALKKAGFSQGTIEGGQGNYAYKILRDENAIRYIMWLKVRVMNASLVNAIDIIDHWVRIAFSDMTDFVDIFPHSIRLKPVSEVDGQLIKSIKSGRDGVSIELYDKLKALDSLAKYCSDMPQEWKQKLEERRMDLMEQDFELKKRQMEMDNHEVEDDEFIEAIKASTEAVWDET